MCQLSDVATYGGDPSKFVDSGYTVDQMGQSARPGSSPRESGALYEYYTTRPELDSAAPPVSAAQAQCDDRGDVGEAADGG